MSSADSPLVQARREALRAWIQDKFAGSRKAFVEDAGSRGHKVDPSEITSLQRGHKSFGEKKALELEMQAGMPAGYLVNPLGQNSASQSVQWDFRRLAIAHQLLREAYADARREPYSVETEPEALIEAYTKLVLAGDDTAAIVAIGRNLSTRKENDEQSLERTSGADQKPRRKRSAG